MVSVPEVTPPAVGDFGDSLVGASASVDSAVAAVECRLDLCDNLVTLGPSEARRKRMGRTLPKRQRGRPLKSAICHIPKAVSRMESQIARKSCTRATEGEQKAARVLRWRSSGDGARRGRRGTGRVQPARRLSVSRKGGWGTGPNRTRTRRPGR